MQNHYFDSGGTKKRLLDSTSHLLQTTWYLSSFLDERPSIADIGYTLISMLGREKIVCKNLIITITAGMVLKIIDRSGSSNGSVKFNI